MYTLYKFHFLNGISEINQLFDDILIIWPAPVYCLKLKTLKKFNSWKKCSIAFLFIFAIEIGIQNGFMMC